MKKIISSLIVFSFLFFGITSLVGATAYDWHWNLRDSGNSGDYNFDLTPPGDSDFRFLVLDPLYNYPRFLGLGTGLYAESGYISIHDLSPAQIPAVNTFMGTTVSTLSTYGAEITDLYNTVSSLSQVQTDWATTSTASVSYIKNKPQMWYNGSLISTFKTLTFSSTTTSGAVTFYMTDNGLVGGTALCSTTPAHINVIVNDPSNTFGVGYTVTNSNKNLNVTVNARSFTSTTILGITVLGSSALSASANGTPVSAMVECQ